LFDVDAVATEALRSAGLNCTAGSLGTLIELPNKNPHDECFCLPKANIPSNLHEYDILVIDLKHTDSVPYNAADHEPRRGKSKTQLAFLCQFPQNLFDPRPFVGFVIRPTVQEIQRKQSIVIVFATAQESVSYQEYEVRPKVHMPMREVTYDNYSFLLSPPSMHDKRGQETTVVIKDTDFGDFLRSSIVLHFLHQ
jgi:hypothetical protein